MSFDATKSTKGASKLRRDLINAEIANLRDLLPLPSSTRQRLSQLQLMALVCVYVRKANYFQQVFRKQESGTSSTPNFGFSKALSGFLMMTTQNGKLLYISDNAAEYLGHSMEDLLIHGDSVYDIIDKQDHQAVQAELLRTPTSPADEERLFLCRMNVSRNARRQMRFGDQKVVLMQGHFLSFLPLCSRNEPVFLATCTPVAMPETRECVVQGATHVFTSIHSMDMKFLHIDKNGEFYLGYSKNSLQGVSWYQLVHWEHMREAQAKHRLITQSEQDRSGILLLRLITHSGSVLWVHAVLQVKDNMDNSQQPVVVCTNQILSEKEAAVMRANSWLYHYYSVQSKLQYGLTFEPHSARMPPYYPTVMPYGMSAGPSDPSTMPSPYLSPPQPGPSSQNGSQHVSPTMPPPPHPYGFPLPGSYHHLPTGPVTESRSVKRRAVFLGGDLSDHHGGPCCPELLSTVAYGCVSGVLTTPLPLPAGPKLKGRKVVAAIPEEDEPWTAASPPWLNEGGSQTVPDVLGGWSPRIRPSVERRLSRDDSEGISTQEQHVPDVLSHHRRHHSFSRVKLEDLTSFTDGTNVNQNIPPAMHHYHPYRLLRPTKFEDFRSDSPSRAGSAVDMISLNTPSSSTSSLRSTSSNSLSTCSNGSLSEPESPGWSSPASWPFHVASRECSRCAVWAMANPQFTSRFTFDNTNDDLKREPFHSVEFPPTPSVSPQSPVDDHPRRRLLNSRPTWPPPNPPNPPSQVMGQMPSCINSPTTCQDAF